MTDDINMESRMCLRVYSTRSALFFFVKWHIKLRWLFNAKDVLVKEQ